MNVHGIRGAVVGRIGRLSTGGDGTGSRWMLVAASVLYAGLVYQAVLSDGGLGRLTEPVYLAAVASSLAFWVAFIRQVARGGDDA